MSLSELIVATGVPWRIEDTVTASGSESDVGDGEKIVGFVVRLRDNRRFQLRAWRRTDGTFERPEVMQLPSGL
jgi:hypothetical protein